MEAKSYQPLGTDSGVSSSDASHEASVVRSTQAPGSSSAGARVEGAQTTARERTANAAGSDLQRAQADLPSFGRFEVLGRVAVGGMAEIFFARERSAGGGIRHLGLKLLKRRARFDEDGAYFEEMFQREGRTAMLLAHPNICHVYEFGKVDDRFFIAMEWISGRSLRDVLARLSERQERIPPALAVAIVIQVADALHYAHNVRDTHGRPLGVVHRDVNPQNIMLRFDGSAQLLDFGVAYVNETQVDTRAGAVKGKLNYMAPEQLFEGAAVDCRVDVFALGICLYEMLSGVRLHKRANMRDMLKAVLHDPAPSLRHAVPAALDDILQRALQKRPEDRFQSAGELQDALESFLAESGEVASRRRVAELMQGLFPGASDDLKPALDSSPEVMSHVIVKPAQEADATATVAAASVAPRRDLRLAALVCALAVLVGGLFAWRTQAPRTLAGPAASAASAAQAPPTALPQALPPAEAVVPPPAAAPTPAASPPAADAAKPGAKMRTREGARTRPKPPAFLAEPGF